MKRKVNFKLSNEALDTIARKAIIHRISQDEVLESIILEFSPSTRQEKKQQIIDRNKAFGKFINAELIPPYFHLKRTKKTEKLFKVWINGYLNGWKLFQLRKATSIFKIPKHTVTIRYMKGATHVRI